MKNLAILDNQRAPTASHPEWLRLSLSALKADYFNPTIPQSHSLTAQERGYVELEIQSLLKLENEIDLDRSAVAVTKLIRQFDNTKFAENSTDQAEGFLDVFEDLPSWAVEKACKKWLRGEVKDQPLAFAPKPPQLRNAVLTELAPMRAERQKLEMLLRAKVEKEYSQEHRKDMLERLAKVFNSVTDQEKKPDAPLSD